MDSEKSPAERTGSEEDFAGAFLFMASRAGAYLNGNQLLTVRVYYLRLEFWLTATCVGRRKDERSACDLLDVSIESHDIESVVQGNTTIFATARVPMLAHFPPDWKLLGAGESSLVTRVPIDAYLAIEGVYIYLLKYRLQIYRV